MKLLSLEIPLSGRVSIRGRGVSIFSIAQSRLSKSKMLNGKTAGREKPRHRTLS